MPGMEYFGGTYGGGSSLSTTPPDVPCAFLFSDDFNDNSINLTNWNVFGSGVVETGQQLRLSTVAASTDYTGVNTIDQGPLEDCQAFIEVVNAGDQTLTSWELYPVHLQKDGVDEDADEVFWLISGNAIIAFKKLAGVGEVVFSAPYVAETHRWFRIRETSGTTYWETSVNGVVWTAHYSEVNPFDYSNLEYNLFVGTYDAEASGSTAIVDNFNIVSTHYSLGGTLLLSGSADPRSVSSGHISGTLVLGGSVDGFIQPILQTADIKEFVYKIYDPTTGDFLGRWDDVVSEFTYSQEINSAGSAIDITLARNSDSVTRSFNQLVNDSGEDIITDSSEQIALELQTTNSIGPGTNVDLNLDVKVYVFPEGAEDIDGTLIFTGYISKYVSRYGSEENTVVTLFSYGSELDNYVLEDSGDTRVPYLTQDPSVILKDALDKFNAAGGIPSYDQGSTTIDTTSAPVSYTFNLNTMLEVVKKCLELAPTDWFWYMDMALNNIHFHAKPSVPDHTFILGKHILELNLEKYIEDITNLVYFTGGPQPTATDPNFFKKYTRPTSISDFRRGLLRISDQRVKLETSADIIVDSILDRGENPRYRSSIRIAAKVYDIESIQLGDLVAFRNFGNYVDELEMQVVRIDYHPDYVQLQLDTLLPSVPKRLEDVKRNLNQSDYEANPDAPDV